MPTWSIEPFPFDGDSVTKWGQEDPRHNNWPVVYTISNPRSIYVGETGNAVARMKQHLATKYGLEAVQVIIDETFNKSACLDLESTLIRLLSGDGTYEVLNRNDGITDAEYFDRGTYQLKFDEIFEELRTSGFFSRSIPEIVNSDLFKLSPFKSLTSDQAVVVESIVDGLFEDLESDARSRSVIEGNPGTGKTIIAIFLVKLLVDIRSAEDDEAFSSDTFLSDYFTSGHRELLEGFRVGLVVPQQSLRRSIQKVFRRTPGLDATMVLTPFEVGADAQDYDLLIVDEAHRLTIYSAQAMGTLTSKYREIAQNLFGHDWRSRTQLDWIKTRSKHQILLVDTGQRVRPADLPVSTLTDLLEQSQKEHRRYTLTSQMRVQADADYVGYVRRVLAGTQTERLDFGEYELQLFDSFDDLYGLIRARDKQHGLSRLVAGYAWRWRSRSDTSAHDIELGSHRLPWNRATADWINSAGSLGEVGSIHTVQGYDLNYAGVIIGNDLRLDPGTGRMYADRSSYFDAKGKANNNLLGIVYSDDDILKLIRNIYGVLLTRGIRGTFVYVCDAGLREYLRRFF